MLYDDPSKEYAPFIPPLPSPELPSSGANTPFIPPSPSPGSVVQPLPVPTPDDREPPPSWARHPQTPMNYAYPSTPYIPPMPSVHSTPASQPHPETPGSYVPAPSALPVSLATPHPAFDGTPAAPPPQADADFTGFPTYLGTPWAPPPPIPPPNATPPWLHPMTPYDAFNQPFLGTPWSQMPPPADYFTQAPAAWPTPPGMSPYPAYPSGYPPWQHPTQQLPPIKGPGGDIAQAAFRWSNNTGRMSSFAEGPHYGPVLEPLLAKIVGARIELNPLLAPPSDTHDDYLRWNMPFPTSNCYRTTEPQRLWIKGRNAPATHPRLTQIRIISRAFPWMIHARAYQPELGVTCGEVLDAISTCMHRRVAKQEYEHLPPGRKRQILDSYRFNRSTNLNAPGERLGEGLKRLDWLGTASRFGGLVANDSFAKEHFGDLLPCTFELQCLSSYPLTSQEAREQQEEIVFPVIICSEIPM